jgi:NTP pyrophosphatase (non-canonical NTP hydrolase)
MNQINHDLPRFSTIFEAFGSATPPDYFHLAEGYAITIGNHLNFVRDVCHGCSVQGGWWKEQDFVGERLHLTVATKIALIHSEVSEALEGYRVDANDDKLPHRKAVEVELADALVRIFDLAGALDLDIGGALAEKLAINARRADHKPENRAKAGGKRF